MKVVMIMLSTAVMAAARTSEQIKCPKYDTGEPHVAPLSGVIVGHAFCVADPDCFINEHGLCAADPGCVHEDCINWDCATWCHCFDGAALTTYEMAGCTDGDDTCDCGGDGEAGGAEPVDGGGGGPVTPPIDVTPYCPMNSCASGWVHKTFRSCGSTTMPSYADKCVGVTDFTLDSGISGCAATASPALLCWNTDNNYQCCEGAGTIHEIVRDYCPGNSCVADWTLHSAICPGGNPATCWNTDNNYKCC